MNPSSKMSVLDLRPRELTEPERKVGLEGRCWIAASRPLEELTPEDLRLLVSQNIGLDIVLPVALSLLEANPLESGDLYTGDLLVAISRVEESAWKTSLEIEMRYQELIHDVSEISNTLLAEVLPNWSKSSGNDHSVAP